MLTVVPGGAWRGLGMQVPGEAKGSWSYLEGPIGDWWGTVGPGEVVVLGGA